MAIEQARELSRQAKQLRRAGDQDAALAMLEAAQRALEAELARGDEATAAALADTFGQIGGTLRERDALVEAAAAYDAGYAYEARYALPTTYNALNRVVTRVLLCPEALAEPEALRRYEQLPWIDVRAEAARLHERLAALEAVDVWALGDLVLTAALTGAELGNALDTLATDTSVRAAYHPIVERLAQLDTPRRASLERLARVLGGAA
jgi:hypothetical protein